MRFFISPFLFFRFQRNFLYIILFYMHDPANTKTRALRISKYGEVV